MFGDGSLLFREFATREPLPLWTIHDTVLEFLRGAPMPCSGAHRRSTLTSTSLE